MTDHRVLMGYEGQNAIFYNPMRKQTYQVKVDHKVPKRRMKKSATGTFIGLLIYYFLKNIHFEKYFHFQLTKEIVMLAILFWLILLAVLSYNYYRDFRDLDRAKRASSAQLEAAIKNNNLLNLTKTDQVQKRDLVICILCEFILILSWFGGLILALDYHVGSNVSTLGYLFFVILGGYYFAFTVVYIFEVRPLRWLVIVHNLQSKDEYNYATIAGVPALIFLVVSYLFVGGIMKAEDREEQERQAAVQRHQEEQIKKYEERRNRKAVQKAKITKETKQLNIEAKRASSWLVKHYSGIKKIEIYNYSHSGKGIDSEYEIDGEINGKWIFDVTFASINCKHFADYDIDIQSNTLVDDYGLKGTTLKRSYDPSRKLSDIHFKILEETSLEEK